MDPIKIPPLFFFFLLVSPLFSGITEIILNFQKSIHTYAWGPDVEEALKHEDRDQMKKSLLRPSGGMLNQFHIIEF